MVTPLPPSLFHEFSKIHVVHSTSGTGIDIRVPGLDWDLRPRMASPRGLGGPRPLTEVQSPLDDVIQGLNCQSRSRTLIFILIHKYTNYKAEKKTISVADNWSKLKFSQMWRHSQKFKSEVQKLSDIGKNQQFLFSLNNPDWAGFHHIFW